MSPTVFRRRGFRFFFFSREEERPHVHMQHATGEAKIWLVPRVTVARNHGLSRRHLQAALQLVEEHRVQITAAWREHFGS